MSKVRVTTVTREGSCPVCVSGTIEVSIAHVSCSRCRWQSAVKWSEQVRAYVVPAQYVAVVVSRTPRRVWDYDPMTGAASRAVQSSKRVPIVVGSYSDLSAAETAAIGEACHRYTLGGCQTAARLDTDRKGHRVLKSATVTGKVVAL